MSDVNVMSFELKTGTSLVLPRETYPSILFFFVCWFVFELQACTRLTNRRTCKKRNAAYSNKQKHYCGCKEIKKNQIWQNV